MSLNEIYQEIIVDHSKNPRHYGQLANATHLHAGHNPLCGDKLAIFAIIQDGRVEKLQFTGEGCAISMASASMMTEAMTGKTLAEVNDYFTRFHDLVTGITVDEDLGKLSALAGVAEFPVRVKCATLAWHTLKAAIQRDDKPVSTE